MTKKNREGNRKPQRGANWEDGGGTGYKKGRRGERKREK